MEKLPKLGIPVLIAVILLLILLFKSFVRIEAGYSGVLYETLSGGVDPNKPAMPQGLNFVMPWNEVIKYEVRQQEVSENMDVLCRSSENYITKKGRTTSLDWYSQRFVRLRVP